MSKQLELCDTFPIKFNINEEKRKTILLDSDNGVRKGYSLVCEVDATHAGTLINGRIYPPKSMKKGLKSWTQPYKKPVLTNHNADQDPIGRVIKAEYLKTPRGLDNSDYEPILNQSDGYGFQHLIVKITDQNAIQKILDGRYETVSVRMSTNHAFCSICGTDWSHDGPCDHIPGQKYDKKLAYITTGDLLYKELSFVNMPADEFAGVKGALLKEEDSELKPIDMSLYASSAKDEMFSNLCSNDDTNLYSMLDDGIEEEDNVVLCLLDKVSKVLKSQKEEEVKLEELTKDQLKDLSVVKELINEEITKRLKADEEKNKEACKTLVDKTKEDFKKEVDTLKKSLETCATEKDSLKTSNIGLKKEKEDTLEEVKSLKDQAGKKEEDSKKLLDENIRINSDLHKMIAERMYDLKKALRKPDLADVKTPDDRKKKVDEFSQRSIDSLKDQISDLLLEYETMLSTTSYFGGDITNPGASRTDNTNEVDSDKTKGPEGKKAKLNRLFSKS